MLRSGVDMVDIVRIEQAVTRWGQRFIQRIWTPNEQEICSGRIASLAGRWAAKEAAAKALGVGVRGLGASSQGVQWHDLEIGRNPQGGPMLIVHGAALAYSETLNIQEWSVSISHTSNVAIAFVIGLSVNL